MASQDIMKQGGRRKIGNGRDTRVWHIPWLPCVENGFLTTDVQSELETTTINTLMHDNGREWDDDILSSLFNDRDRQLILQIPLSSRNINDSWYWLLDNDGVFSVRSCYRRIRGEREYADRSFWKKLWRIKLPGKVLNFLWRVCRNVLPTAVALVSKHVNIQQVCSWCHLQNEDTMHTLFSCGFGKEVWYSMGLQRLLPNCDEISVLQIFKQVFSANSSKVCARFGLICWVLWIRRNSWVWSRKNMSVFGVTAMVTNLLQDLERSQKEQRHMPSGIQQRKWCKPPQGWVKINVNAACRGDNGYMGVGCVIRDENGRFFRGRTSSIRRCMQAREAESLKEALMWTKNWRTTRCIFELDAKVVVDAIHGTPKNSMFHIIIDECLEILKHFEEVLVVFDLRSANRVAHTLAQASYSMPGPTEWFHAAPDFICNLIDDEK